MPQPQFEGQTKGKLIRPKGAVESFLHERLTEYFDQITVRQIVGKLLMPPGRGCGS